MKRKLWIALIVAVVLAVGLRIGLPAALRAGGLHPEFSGQRYLVPEGKALIVCTSLTAWEKMGLRPAFSGLS